MCPLHVIRKLKADRVSGSLNTEGTHPANSRQIKQDYQIEVKRGKCVTRCDNDTSPFLEIISIFVTTDVSTMVPSSVPISLATFELICPMPGQRNFYGFGSRDAILLPTLR